MRLSHLAVLGLLTLTGCPKGGLGGALDQFKPTLKFKKIDFKDATFKGADAEFVFAIHNPNPIKVSLANYTYELSLKGNRLLSGKDKDGATLKASGDSELRLPIHLDWAEVIDVSKAMKGVDTVPFSLDGDFGFQTPIGPVKIPYSKAGKLPVIRPPHIAVKSLKFNGINAGKGTVGLGLDLAVSHDQGSPVTFDDFGYKLSLGGGSVAHGKASLPAVEAGKTANVTIPVDIDVVNLGAAVLSALKGKEKVDFGLSGNVDVGTKLGKIPLSIDESGRVDVR